MNVFAGFHGTMRRHLVNIVFVTAALFLVTACFWSADKDEDISVSDPDSGESANTSPKAYDDSPVSPAIKKDAGDFIVDHLAVETPRYQELDRQVKADQLLEKAAEKLNRALVLPEDIFLRTKDCKQINAFYDPAERSVTMCYELMEHFYKTFKSVGHSDDIAYGKMSDAVRFVFLHEIAHALIDQYKLPIAGNEEDAADRCSAFINLKELGDEGVRAVFAAADAFKIESTQNTGAKRNLADEHLLQEQRFYNSLCMIYGSNPEKHADIVAKGYLPKERAGRCQTEYRRSVDSWISLLEPWRK